MNAAQFEEDLIRERIRIRAEKMEDLRFKYNELNKKLKLMQEKVELLACENFKDAGELRKVISKNQQNKNQ